jgi:enolase
MIVPNTRNLLTDIQLSSEVYHTLKKILKDQKFATGVGDEGGFAPSIKLSTEVLTLLNEAIEKAGYTALDCNLALDVAASELYNAETDLYSIDDKTLTRAELTDLYADLSEQFNLISIEDPFAEDDVLGWQMITKKIGAKRLIVGDDLFVTNSKRLEEIGFKQEAGNSILIKPNQIGTILQTCQTIELARSNKFATIISHRSGETTDTFIADLAVASQSEFIKLGAPCRGERVAKYNRLIEIFQQIES